MLYGLPEKELSKVQRIQNSAARLVTRTKQREHVTPTLTRLHWLPVKKRIIYKTLLLTYKCLNGLAPNYLSGLLQEYKPSRVLRSSFKQQLQVPSSRTKYYGGRAFSIYAPKQWNSLPLKIRKSDSVDSFKKELKTFLFCNDIGFF